MQRIKRQRGIESIDGSFPHLSSSSTPCTATSRNCRAGQTFPYWRRYPFSRTIPAAKLSANHTFSDTSFLFLPFTLHFVLCTFWKFPSSTTKRGWVLENSRNIQKYSAFFTHFFWIVFYSVQFPAEVIALQHPASRKTKRTQPLRTASLFSSFTLCALGVCAQPPCGMAVKYALSLKPAQVTQVRAAFLHRADGLQQADPVLPGG
jgi:hypothetical protein